MLIPAGRADHYGSAALGTANDVGNHGVRRGEVENHVNLLEQLRGERASILIFLAGQRTHFMSALCGHFGDERAGFAPSQNEKFHANTSGKISPRRPTTAGLQHGDTEKTKGKIKTLITGSEFPD